MKAKKIPIPNYPKPDHVPGHHPHYVYVPVLKNGKWRAGEVVEGGYLDPFNNPTKIDFDTEAECQKACDHHNHWHGWSDTEIETIISLSMGLAPKK